MRLELERAEAREEALQKELSAEKRANDEMLGVLMKLDAQEKELWGNYNLVSAKYQELSERNR